MMTWVDVIEMLTLLWSSWKEKRQNSFRRYTVASKFARFKSGWLQSVEHTASECVQNTHHWSQTSHQNQNWVGQAGSRHAAVRQWRRRLSACVRAGGGHFEHCFWFWHCVFAKTADFKAFVDLLNLTVTIPVWFSCSCLYNVVSSNTWRSFNSQGKVVTLFRCNGNWLLAWFRITLKTFRAKITTTCIYLCLSKSCLIHYRLHFFRGTVYYQPPYLTHSDTPQPPQPRLTTDDGLE